MAAEGLLSDLGAPDIPQSRIYRMLHPFHPAALTGVAATHDTGIARVNLVKYVRELQGIRTELTGRDLIALGVAEGPEIGRLLDVLLDARLDGNLADRLEEEALIRRMVS